jgi:PAS domain S-box-containing protein
MNQLKQELYSLIQSETTIFDFIQEHTLDGLWYWNLENSSEGWINDKFWKEMGYRPEEVENQATAWMQMMHPDDLILVKENFNKHFDNPEHSVDQIVRYIHKNGQTLWIKIKGIAIRDEHGRPTRMLGVHINTTEEKRKEILLMETNRTAKVGSWEFNLVNNTLYWSEVTKIIHEVPLDFVPNVETGINFYKEGKSRETITRCLEKAMSDGTAWDVELQLVTAKGNEIWVRAIGETEFYEGKCVRIFGVFQDIDERKKAQRIIVKERAFLQTLIDNLPVNVYVKDLESRKTLINKKELEHMGVTDIEKVLGKNDHDLYPKWSADISRKEDLEVFETGKGFVDLETMNEKKDGEKNWFLTSKIPLKEEGKITSILGISYNITKYKQAEDKLRQLSILESKSKEMEQFAYVASHDLREPLLTIRGYAELLDEDFSEDWDEEAREVLGYIQKAVNRMDALIHGLLDYSRLSKVKELETVDIDAVIEDVKADLDAAIRGNDGLILAEKLPVITGHSLEIKLLFQNLVSNAIKFKQADILPKIEISSQKIEKGWQFSVKDNGIGMEKRNIRKIFNIFSRLHSKEKYPGTGIGLANCKKIVELHNGKIWVESSPNEGSTFYFTILTDI